VQRSELVTFDSEWRNQVATLIGNCGMRQSQARATVLDWIAAAACPFTAEMIVAQLVIRWGRSSRATVYRTVDWLHAAGWLARLNADGVDRAYVRRLPDSLQLICTACGSVRALHLDVSALVTPHVQALGFELQDHHLELYGRCQNCRQRNETDG
jgi:Fur family transcriptional regulator, ferric uptake regulator